MVIRRLARASLNRAKGDGVSADHLGAATRSAATTGSPNRVPSSMQSGTMQCDLPDVEWDWHAHSGA